MRLLYAPNTDSYTPYTATTCMLRYVTLARVCVASSQHTTLDLVRHIVYLGEVCPFTYRLCEMSVRCLSTAHWIHLDCMTCAQTAQVLPSIVPTSVSASTHFGGGFVGDRGTCAQSGVDQRVPSTQPAVMLVNRIKSTCFLFVI
jgi:hypothetical protein